MAASKIERIEKEIQKTREKITEYQNKLKGLEAQKTEAEKLEIVQLVRALRLTPAHLSNIETGNTKLSLPTLIRIANALSVSVDDLLCDNVIHSNHVFNKEAQEILADCSPYDIRILLDILKSAKEALRRDERFKANMEQKKGKE